MMAFHEVRFPASLSRGSMGGPERLTEIVALTNGFEERNSPWAHSRRRYDAGMGLRSLDDLAALIAFFEARAGQLHGFRWKDWSDFKSGVPSAAVSAQDELLGHGDGRTTVFALRKAYRSGATVYHRPIAKPVAGTVRVAVGSVELVLDEQFTVDATTGLVTLKEPPGTDIPVKAGFEFDVPVRFDSDRLMASVANFQAGELPHVPVVEVRL